MFYLVSESVAKFLLNFATLDGIILDLTDVRSRISLDWNLRCSNSY